MLELKEHQIKGAQFMFDNAYGVANTSQMGTGKTAMAITAFCMVQPARILVVCPGSLLFNWGKEIDLWGQGMYTHRVLTGTKAKRLKALAEATGSLEVVIINYDALNSVGEELIKWKPEMIILDESHCAKNHKAIRTKAINAIADKSKTEYRWIMTGTPAPNNCLDVFAQYDFIRPGFLGPNYYAFRATYANVYTGAGFPQIVGFKRQDELQKKLAAYSYRVTKDECLDLPDKTFITIDVELEEKNRVAYKSMAENLVAEIGDQKVTANIILVKMLRLQQMTSGFVGDESGAVLNMGTEKLDALMDLLESLSDQKVVVWCRFNHEIKMIAAAISAADKTRKVRILQGSVSNEDRQSLVEEFQSGPHTNDIILANVQVGGVGITLTAAAYAIYFSRTFSYGDASQSEDRLHRIGQTRKVTYYDLCVRGSIDAYILKAIKKKEKMSDHLTGDDIKRMAMGE